MTIEALRNDPELQRVLRACLDYWNAESISYDKRTICYSWVARRYEDMFGGTFHRSKLQRLARFGLLTKDDTSRGGSRRYYRIDDPAGVEELLKGCNLN